MTQKHPHLGRILRVIDHIYAHADRDLPLDELADVAALSRFHFHRVFSALLGQPPAAAIRSVRLHKASMLLVESDVPVSDIAARVGYSNTRSFARAFRGSYGCGPDDFRAEGHAVRNVLPTQKDKTMYGVSIQTVDDMRLAALMYRGAYAQVGSTFQKLSTILSTGGHWPQTRGMVAVCYDDPSTVPEAELRTHAGVWWAGQDVPEGTEDVTLAGGRYAVLRLKGPYTGLAPAYGHLYGAWLAQSGETLRDAPSFELYLNDPTSTAPDDLLTDIYMPLAG